MRFLDTNILLYSISRAPEERPKRQIARNILTGQDFALSAQVLQEFYYQSTRPSALFDLNREEVREFVVGLNRFAIVPITYEIVLAAIVLCERFQISYWDGAILAAARVMGCDSVLSEDLNPQQDYDGLRVINPFV